MIEDEDLDYIDKFYKEIANLIEQICLADLAEPPANYKKLKIKALNKLAEAYDILKKLDF